MSDRVRHAVTLVSEKLIELDVAFHVGIGMVNTGHVIGLLHVQCLHGISLLNRYFVFYGRSAVKSMIMCQYVADSIRPIWPRHSSLRARSSGRLLDCSVHTGACGFRLRSLVVDCREPMSVIVWWHQDLGARRCTWVPSNGTDLSSFSVRFGLLS